MKKIFVLLFAGLIYLTACNNETNKMDTTKATVNLDSTEAINTIIKADNAWDSVSALNSADGWLSYYTDDAIMMPPGEKVCLDKASRAVSIKAMFATPGANMRFQATKTEVAKSGDLGYSTGAYQFSYKDAAGKDAHETGKFCETWKKQADGSWKCIVDIWNADPVAK
jgi:ketosteroid isomerase-like protein